MYFAVFNVYMSYTKSCVHGSKTSSPSPGKEKSDPDKHDGVSRLPTTQPLARLLRPGVDHTAVAAPPGELRRRRTAVTYASTGLVHAKSLSIHALIPLRARGRLSQGALATPLRA